MSTFEVDSSQRVPIKMWTKGVPVEDQAAQQLRNVTNWFSRACRDAI